MKNKIKKVVVSIMSLLSVGFASFNFTSYQPSTNLIPKRAYSTITGKWATLKVKIFAYYNGENSSAFGFGHAFITVENLAYNEQTFGYATLNVTQGATVGTWGNKSEHKGLWYNLEKHFLIQNKGVYNGIVSLTTYLDENEANVLHAYVRDYDSWSTFNNCSSFAAGAWNLISNEKVTAGLINTPENLANSIKCYSDYKTNDDLPSYCGKVFYMDNGVKTYSQTYAMLTSLYDDPYSYRKEL